MVLCGFSGKVLNEVLFWEEILGLYVGVYFVFEIDLVDFDICGLN